MLVKCVWEHNGNDSLIYADNFIGAFTRGARKEEALAKFQKEIPAYLAWKTGEDIRVPIETQIVQERASNLQIADADSDVLFESEKPSLAMEEYGELKALALKSAGDFERLYQAFPSKEESALLPRKTFYGEVPTNARQMYAHTKGVNAYYFGEIGVDVDCEGAIDACRARGFALLEQAHDFLDNRIFDGSYGEQWTLRKVLRRFVWHDRIHAKALYRMGCKTFGKENIPDVFCFGK